jgi:hypothetical protein
MGIEAGRAYSRRAVEYANLFGSMGAVHPSDRQLVDTWAEAITGPVVDAGCGPGQWTNYLVQRGTVASAVVPWSIATASDVSWGRCVEAS